MSNTKITAVWNGPKSLRDNRLVVLLALADWERDEKGYYECDVRDIADRVRLKRRQVFNILRWCKAEGYLTISDGVGRSRQSRYTVQAEVLAERAAQERAEQGAAGAIAIAPFTDTKGATEQREPELKGAIPQPEKVQSGDLKGAIGRAQTHQPHPHKPQFDDFSAEASKSSRKNPDIPTAEGNTPPKATRTPEKGKKNKPLVWPADFDLPLVWQLCQVQQPNVPIAWNYGRETNAIHAMLEKQPEATETDFATFLGYLRQTFPYNKEPHRQVKFSAAGVEQFLNWWGLGKPEQPPPRNNGGPARRLTRDESGSAAIQEEMEYRRLRDAGLLGFVEDDTEAEIPVVGGTDPTRPLRVNGAIARRLQ